MAQVHYDFIELAMSRAQTAQSLKAAVDQYALAQLVDGFCLAQVRAAWMDSI
jgi:hypothetical protein